MEKNKSNKGGMKTAKHTMAENDTKNQEEFISNQPNDFDDRNLDKEGVNRPTNEEKSEKRDRKGKYSDGGYDHPPQDGSEHKKR